MSATVKDWPMHSNTPKKITNKRCPVSALKKLYWIHIRIRFVNKNLDPDPDQDSNLYFDADQDLEPIIDCGNDKFKFSVNLPTLYD